MKNVIVIGGLVVALATGASVAHAGPGHDGERPRADRPRGESKSKGHGERCAKLRKAGFVVAGTFASGDARGVTLTVTKANRHARRSGLVTVGEQYTATPTGAGRIRYVNRTGPTDAKPTDRVRVVGKVTLQRRGCGSEDFAPEAAVRTVTVRGPDSDDDEN